MRKRRIANSRMQNRVYPRSNDIHPARYRFPRETGNSAQFPRTKGKGKGIFCHFARELAIVGNSAETGIGIGIVTLAVASSAHRIRLLLVLNRVENSDEPSDF